MRMSELKVNQQLTIAISWGERSFEFRTFVLMNAASRVYVNPYIHNGSELPIDTDKTKGIICTVYAIDPTSNQRISWNNVDITTVRINDQTMYHISTANYNLMSKSNDRRRHDRITIQTQGKVTFDGENFTQVLVHDISDNGISFYAPMTFSTDSNQLTLSFIGKVDEKIFDISVELLVERITTRMGNILYGCRIAKENREYLLFGLMLRVRKGPTGHM